ncbi:DUF5050 domain-containing protein [Paenibacillus lutrae]|nr:DUF5050 domain-containing protein [Paenibacillus lutrae]
MRMKRFLLTVVSVCSISTVTMPIADAADEPEVKVTLPNFTVNLNGNIIDNEYREYPLLVYKDITYFPMTWYDSRLLGLEARWSPADGLNIVKKDVTASYRSYTKKVKNDNTYKATVPASVITINGSKVNNAKEEYPLLSFNNVTYFPLTWKYAHDHFGWDYKWDASTGLAITSENPPLRTVDLPAAAAHNQVALYKGYYYYTEVDDRTIQIYRAPEDAVSHKELVYEYEGDTAYGLSSNVSFQVENGELWFSYHVGGAIMGSDVYGKVNADGKGEVKHRGYLDFKKAAGGSLLIHQSVPPKGNNLSLVPEGLDDTAKSSLGDPKLIYGWHISSGSSQSLAPDHSTAIVNDDIYILASTYPAQSGGKLNRIHRINLRTNVTSEITTFPVEHFKVLQDKLYYVKEEDHFLYTSNLDGSDEKQLSDNPTANWYEEVGGNVYYTVRSEEEGRYRLYKAAADTDDIVVVWELLESVQVDKDTIIVQTAADKEYGVKLLDASGSLKMSIAGQASHVGVYDGSIVFVSAADQTIKRLELRK